MLLGQQHGIDHVNDAVFGLNVDRRNRRVAVEDYLTVFDLDGNALTLNGFGFFQGNHLARGHPPGHHVVGQDLGEGSFVSQKLVQVSFWNLGKGCVGRRKDCEGAFSRKGVCQACRLYCRQQGGEVGVGSYYLCDGLVLSGALGVGEGEAKNSQGQASCDE